MKFLKKLINSFKGYESKYGIIIVIILVIIHIPWLNFSGVSAPDTHGYVDVSENWFVSDYIYLRPIVYPLFLSLSRLIFSTEFGAIVYFQVFLYGLSGLIFYKILVNQKIFYYKLHTMIVVLISFSVPQALQMNEVILPEMLPLFFILLLFYFMMKPNSLKNSLVISILTIIPILLKPLWLLLLVLPLLKVFYIDKNLKNIIFVFIIPFTIVIFSYSVNQFVVSKRGVNGVTASTLDVNINLSLIRMGLVKGSENTKLNNYLKSKGLLETIKIRNWTNDKDEFLNFTKIKNQIPWNYREDSQFWKSVLLKNPENLLSYSFIQLSRIPDFFSASGAHQKVIFLPKTANKLYQSFFFNIHSKHIVGILIVFFAMNIGLFNFKQFSFHKLLFFFILGVCLILCLLTYQNPHFRRMRAVVEPLIIYISIFTFIDLTKYLYHKYAQHKLFLKFQKIKLT